MSWEHVKEDEFKRRMLKGWANGLHDKTQCGAGSTLANTESIRQMLPDLLLRYQIKTVCDAGAGDLHWRNSVELPAKIFSVDLVPRHPDVQELDITRQAVPPCDLILCRMVLNHMDAERVQSALALFKTSATYLLATQHPGENPAQSADYTKWNLALAPFSLGEPLESLRDCRDFSLSLWRVQ